MWTLWIKFRIPVGKPTAHLLGRFLTFSSTITGKTGLT
jgi:hypothetical protein